MKITARALAVLATTATVGAGLAIPSAAPAATTMMSHHHAMKHHHKKKHHHAMKHAMGK